MAAIIPLAWSKWLKDLDSTHFQKVRGFCCWMVTNTAHLFEAICELDLRPVPSYMPAAEGAPVDCVVFIHEQPLPSTFFNADRGHPQHAVDVRTERLLTARSTYKDKPVVLVMDVKHLHAKYNKSTNGGLYRFSMHWTRSQHDMTVVLLAYSSLAPELVACVPKKYLQSLSIKTSDKNRGIYYFAEHPLTSAQPPAFPMELAPFVMPRSELGACISSLEAWYRGGVDWRNPYNGVVLAAADDAKPQLQPVSVLYPSDSSGLQDMPFLEDLWNLMYDNDSGLSLAYPSITPSVGDFFVVEQRGTETKMHCFELKRSMLHIGQHASGYVRVTLFSQSGKRYFAPWTMWAFLLATDERGRHYCFPRPIFPQKWSTMPLPEDPSIKWYVTRETLNKYRLPSATPGNGPRYNARLAEIIRSADDLPALQDMSDESYLQACVQVVDQDLAIVASNSTKIQGVPRPLRTLVRGEGRQHSAVLSDGDMEVKLRSQCDELGRGCLIRLGTHPGGRYAFADIPLASELGFFDLSLSTPMIYINSAEISLTGERIPTDAGRQAGFLHATHGSHRSFYLLKNKSPGAGLEASNWYLVPSETIDTAERREISRVWLEPGRHEANGSMLILSQGEALDAYAVPASDIVLALLSLVRKCCQNRAVKLGDGIDIETANYLTDRSSIVHQELVTYDRDALFVGHIRKRKPLKAVKPGMSEYEEDSMDDYSDRDYI